MWRELGDLIRARSFFERLAAIDPEHPVLGQFEAQIGEKLSASAAAPTPAPAEAAPRAASEPAPAPARSEPAPARSEPAPAAPADESKIAELRAQLEEQEGKRHHEYVKTLVALADEVSDPAEKVELLLEAADLYVHKFVNQAEAVKTYEHVLAIDAREPVAHRVPAANVREATRLGEADRASDQAKAEQLEAGPARSAMFKEIAKLATERVKKPEVCIELWAVVLDNDAG